MNLAIIQIFIGFLIVAFSVPSLTLYILVDPLGYALIASGLNYFSKTYKQAKVAQIFSIILFVISIPQTFVSFYTFSFLIGNWHFYTLAVNILNIALAYFIFVLLIKLAQTYNNTELNNQTKTTMKVYLILSFIIAFSSALIDHLNTNLINILPFLIILSITHFIIHVIFLVLIFKFRNLDEHTDYEEKHINTEG